MLREALLSTIDKAETNTRDYGGVFGTPIYVDDENDDKFYLFVGFTEYNGYSSFGYSFQLIDKYGNAKTGLLVKREDVGKILPNNLKGKQLIIPIILNLTRKLLNDYKPKIVFRETTEVLSNYSLMRYEEITKIFLNEFMYKLTKKGKDEFGHDFWFMELVNENNITPIDENSEYINLPSKSERDKTWENKMKTVLNQIKIDISNNRNHEK